MDLTDPTTTALVTVDAFERIGLEHALYGGLLLAAYGEPRETRDVDLAVGAAGADAAGRALAAVGLVVKVAFEDLVFGGHAITRLTVTGDAQVAGLNVIDLVHPRSARYALAALARSVDAPLRQRTVRVLTPEDFVLFKVLSTRDRDIEDAASVLRRSGGALDDSLIDGEAGTLARELPDVAVLERLAAVRQRAGSR